MDRFAVIGLGRFGYRLAVLLSKAGAEVIAVDSNREAIEDIRDEVTLAICMDSTDEDALRSQGLDKVDVAVVGIGNDFESAMLTTVILKQLGVRKVISRATTSVRGEILKRIGADSLVNPEEEAAARWSHRLLGPRIMEQIELAEGHSLVQVLVPGEWVGKTLTQLDVRRKHRVNIVAIRHDSNAPAAGKQDRPVVEMPLPTSRLEAGDVLVLIGADDAIAGLPA